MRLLTVIKQYKHKTFEIKFRQSFLSNFDILINGFKIRQNPMSKFNIDICNTKKTTNAFVGNSPIISNSKIRQPPLSLKVLIIYTISSSKHVRKLF